jgi:DNA modification methylase
VGHAVAGFASIVERFTVLEQIVLDPFCGAGTTGMAALARGRRFIGIDIEPVHVATAAERLKEAATDAA